MKVDNILGIDEGDVSGIVKEKIAAYHAVYDRLDEKQTYAIDQMCKMFMLASCAYRHVATRGKGHDQTILAICEAGVTAYQFMIHMENLIEYYKCNEEELCSKIDATSDWLRERGWISLPEPKDENGTQHIKTSAGMIADMKKYIGVYEELTETLRKSRESGKVS